MSPLAASHHTRLQRGQCPPEAWTGGSPHRGDSPRPHSPGPGLSSPSGGQPLTWEGNFLQNSVEKTMGTVAGEDHPQAKLTAGPAGWSGSGLGAANKDLGKKNEGQDPNGHCPQRPLKALRFGDQLIIQTSRFEKEDV